MVHMEGMLVYTPERFNLFGKENFCSLFKSKKGL